ncbi:hypothetical protein PF002_g31344 [Phytophthora fragariae]|uniref:Uncharacterized protein n=1 Tax=Phytophthora fragariae TaxID=53985 RepID=A0A6A3VH74_9STRA|nr:hypothetical protein PF009_g31233 [Phytophthora fragariae]KAE9059948.1 hypothetical protein PF007_g30779 [Phytophthora fragariae]KAE9165539.1 hypothetical protein PF002_g31344 [Phytophthora fragariae]
MVVNPVTAAQKAGKGNDVTVTVSATVTQTVSLVKAKVNGPTVVLMEPVVINMQVMC